MTLTAPTIESLQEEIAAFAARQDEATLHTATARALYEKLDGQAGRVPPRATEAEVADAAKAVTAAETEEKRLARSLAVLQEELAEAEQAESAAGQARLVESHAAQFAGYKKALGRHDRQLAATETGISELADFDQELRANRAKLTAVLDREDEIRAEFQREFERLSIEAVARQWSVNTDTLDRRQDSALAAMRADVARQVDELLPLPDPAEVEQVRAKHSAVGLLLLAPELRRAISEGLEFIQPPARAGLLGNRVPFTGRLYADHEIGVAQARHQALLDALAQLGPAARPIGAETMRYRTTVAV